MRVRLFAPRYWLTWAGLGLLRVAALLPFPLMVAVGRALGAVLRRLPIGFVRTARRNLELCFPELSRSEEHTSELQSQSNLVCRLLLEKKKKRILDSQTSGI